MKCTIKITLFLDEQDIIFEPNVSQVESVILSKIEEILTASNAIPRLERRLFPDKEVSGAGISDFGLKLGSLVLNGTNSGIFKISFQYVLALLLDK